MPMSATELADATLTATGAITGEQRILVILGEMAGKIPQLEFDPAHHDKGSRFIPRQTGPTPQQLLDKKKNEIRGHDGEINECWVKLMFASPTETRGQKALFSGYSMDKAWDDNVVANQVSYDGEIIVASSWRPDLGFPINDPYKHFRLVYLLNGNSSIAANLQDPRTVVIEAAPLSDKLKDFCCTYLSAKSLLTEFDPQRQKGPEAADIRAFADAKFIDALSSIIHYLIEPFQRGKAHTKDGLNLDVLGALSKPTPDQRHFALIRPALENAYKDFPQIFDVNRIEKHNDAADARNLFLGLVQGDTSKAVRSTLEQKAVGLGLSTPDDPKRLNPQNSQLFKILDQRLAKSSALVLWPLVKELAASPYGIPPHLLAAILLIYVRFRNVPTPVEIQLNPQHRLASQSGRPLSKNLITRSNVVELSWQTGMESSFDSLVAVSGPDWNSIQPFAKILWAEAKPVTFPQDIDNQISGFLNFLKSQLPLAQSAAANLKTLADGLGEPLPETDNQYIKKFEDICASPDLETFEERRKLVHVELNGFKAGAERFEALRRLASMSTQVIQLLNALKQSDTGSDQELSTQKSMLLTRYKLASMICNETVVKALLNDTEKVLERLRNAQQVHSKRMRESLIELKQSLKDTKVLLTGLGQVNQLTTLGPAQGHDLANRLDKLLDSVEKELSGASTHHRSLSYEPPKEEALEIHQTSKQAFENRVSLLRSQLEKAIQDKSEDKIKTLLDLLQLNELHKAATTITPAMIQTIREILDKARTQVVKSHTLEHMADRFPAVSREDIDKFIAELRKLLEKEFADKKQEGKIILLSFR